jgi:AcrR family transcriptional regulator
VPRSAQKRVQSASPRPSRASKKRAGGLKLVQPVVSPERSSQRQRLIEAMIELCAQRGYLNVSVADVSAQASVSSKTFYEIFADKEDCLLAAYRAAAARLLENTEPVGETEDWREAASEVLQRLLVSLQQQPEAGRLLLVEALAGGARVRGERERIVEIFEGRADQFLQSASRDGRVLDLPATAVIGAVRSLVSRHLRTRTEDRLPTLTEDLLAWLESYAVPGRQTPWSTGSHSMLPASAVTGRAGGPVSPQPDPLPRGRHGLPASVIARSQRTRIIHGTAEVMMRNGYADTTVSEIVAAAGISREVFYAHFENKLSAYLAAQQHATHYILEVCTSAYFRQRSWPERIWAVLTALIDVLAANPELAHLRLVECYAAGPAAIENTEELKRSATIFLEEGFNTIAPGRTVPRLASSAISGTIFDLLYTDIARGDFKTLKRRVPQLTYIAIAPFLGPAQAIESLEQLRARAVAAKSRG